MLRKNSLNAQPDISREDNHVTKGEFEGNWKQIRGQAKEIWGKLTDDELEKVNGNFDKFIGLLQEKYSYTRTRAKKEFESRIVEYQTEHRQASLSRN
jgi:uncharacterized protein YjbJ (UPF0337 family)